MESVEKLKKLIKYKVSNNRAKVVMLGLVDEIVKEPVEAVEPKATKKAKKHKTSKEED